MSIMRIIALLAISLIATIANAQIDSTEIRLSHYKDLYIKGLINEKEYEQLKKRDLKLSDSNDPAASTIKPDTIKRIGFNVAISPVYAYTAQISGLENGLLSSGDYVPIPAHHGGIHVGMGPSFYRRHKLNVVIGLEGAKNFFLYPIYLQYTYNILGGMFSPVISTGGGFVGARYRYTTTHKNSYGGQVCLDLGLAVTKLRFSFNLTPGYRLLMNSYGWYVVNNNGARIGWERGMALTHQFTLRASFIFY